MCFAMNVIKIFFDHDVDAANNDNNDHKNTEARKRKQKQKRDKLSKTYSSQSIRDEPVETNVSNQGV